MNRFDVKLHNVGVVLTERTDILAGPVLYVDIWVCGTFEVRDGKIVLPGASREARLWCDGMGRNGPIACRGVHCQR